jgi:phospholipase C
MFARPLSTTCNTLFLCFAIALPAVAQVTNFKHVILMVQENRTPDSLFYSLCLPPYGTSDSCSTTPTGVQYNIQTANWLDKTSTSGVTQPVPVQLDVPYDLGHEHVSFAKQCDKVSGVCQMDGAAFTSCNPPDSCTAFPHPQFEYVDNSSGLISPYLDIATQYGWANYMFETHQGPSYPAHQYLFSATSSPSNIYDQNGFFASENGTSPTGNSGCLSPANIIVPIVNPQSKESYKMAVYPCFEHSTLSDLLEQVGVTWRYYSPGGTSVWTAPTSINHICVPSNGACTGPDWVNNVDLLASDVLTDIANCNLQQVSWVIPIGTNSDHPKAGNTGGPSWVASVVNAIGNSYANSGGKCDYWGNNTGDQTAVIVTWDEWGGWYDHQPAIFLDYPQGGYQLGFRVPLLFVSAFTPVQYVNNEQQDFGSIIRFVEQNYGIAEGALTFADSRSATDLTSFYDLTQVPRPFVSIASPRSADDIIHDVGPQTDPDDY